MGSISEFMSAISRHFNAAVLKDAARTLTLPISMRRKMMITLAGR